MTFRIERTSPGMLTPSLVDEFVAVFAEVFREPPYLETAADFEDFRDRLPSHAGGPGFLCVTARTPDGELAGFAYGYHGGPHSWWYSQVAPELDADARERWLDDYFEFVELAVVPPHRRRGIGGALHDTLLDAAVEPTAALSTFPPAKPAMTLYRRRGWQVLLPEFTFPGARSSAAILGLDLATWRRAGGGSVESTPAL